MQIRHKFAAVLFAVALASCFPVSAQEAKTELSLFGGYRFGGTADVDGTDAEYEARDAPSYGIIWNREHSAETQWEVYFSRQQTDMELSDPTIADPRVDIEFYKLELGGTYLWDGDKVRPYLALTLGGTHIKTESGGGESDTFFSGSLGLGLKFQTSERLGFRLEGRAHGVLVNDSTELFCQTGPNLNVCAVRLQGDWLGQFETFAGVTLRF